MPVFSIGFDAISVRYGASQTSSSLDAVGKSADMAEKNVKSFSSTLKSAAQIALATVGAYQAMSKITSFMGDGVAYNRQLENAKLGIAAVLSSTTELESAQGRLLRGAEKFAAAQQMSTQMAKALAEHSLSSRRNILARRAAIAVVWTDKTDRCRQNSSVSPAGLSLTPTIMRH